MTRDMIARSIEHWRVHRFGLFSFRLCASGAFAGYSGIKHTAIKDAELIELAHAVPSALWRSGYATEMSQAAVRFAFEQLPIEELVAVTLPHNLGSRSSDRALCRIGCTHCLSKDSSYTQESSSS